MSKFVTLADLVRWRPEGVPMSVRWLKCLIGASVFFTRLGGAADVARTDCFPDQKLPGYLRIQFQSQLLAALDREFLYTIVGGLKPLSGSGLRDGLGVEFDYPDLEGVANLNRLLPAWRCGDEIYADVQVYWDAVHPRTGKRRASLLVVNVPSFARLLQRNQDLFGKFGFTPGTNPTVVWLASWLSLTGKEHAGPSDAERNIMQGLLVGYPEAAVRWYASTDPSVHQARAGAESVKIPVYDQRGPLGELAKEGETPASSYVWSAPTEQRNDPEVGHIKQTAARILAEYKLRRERYIGPGKRGVVEMMRDWFDDGSGRCSPSNAMRRK
jgi:hypothetical protein